MSLPCALERGTSFKQQHEKRHAVVIQELSTTVFNERLGQSKII